MNMQFFVFTLFCCLSATIVYTIAIKDWYIIIKYDFFGLHKHPFTTNACDRIMLCLTVLCFIGHHGAIKDLNLNWPIEKGLSKAMIQNYSLELLLGLYVLWLVRQTIWNKYQWWIWTKGFNCKWILYTVYSVQVSFDLPLSDHVSLLLHRHRLCSNCNHIHLYSTASGEASS